MSSERGSSHTNLEIGRTLERARAERGFSLWQVEEATKIRARYLHDLERENFDVLPAVYVLGSLKTYADFLGLDGEAMVRELKNRQAPPPEERDPMPEEEAPRDERSGGFLAALGGLPVVGGREAGEDDERLAPATASGKGFRLYLGVGTILILALAIALGSILADGGEPAVSQVREPTISEAPSRIAFSGDAQAARDDERYREANDTDDQAGKRAESPDEGDDADKKVDGKDRNDKDATQPEDTGDVAVTLPASVAASASASATATSAPTTSASASASSAASTSAAGTPVASATASPSSAPAATAPETAEPNAAPGAAGAFAGPRRVVVADGTRPVERIVGKVRIVRVR